MKTLTKLFLALGIAFSLTACGGGGGDDLFDDGYTDNGYDDNYNTDNGYDENYDNGGDSVSLQNLAGRSISDSNGGYIDFCSDGSIYYYLNSNGNHTGTYNVVNSGYKLDFYDSDRGSYAIETSNGYLEEGMTYYIINVESFTVSSIGYSNC